ncbi:MAG TPA: HAMP domain-containing sensor histidine kinase [Ktedonobacterales bacterium]|nr:HAMP domain-containing sensor histidine kinase [Ktedonobacterales bacterium]
MMPTTPGAPSGTGARTPPVDISDELSLAKTPLLPAERAMLKSFDDQRRLALLRIIAPALLVITVLSIPFAVQADMMGGTFTSRMDVGIGVLGSALALWATRTRRVTTASLALFATITGVILDVLVTDGLVGGRLDVSILPEFQLLLLPIAIAGVFGGPPLVIFATIVANTVTLALIILTPHTVALDTVLARSNGLVVFTVPLSTQLTLGALMIAATYMLRRTLRDLSDTRVAYAREKELDRLKDQFIASVNHELRTPIMALQGYVALADALGERGERDKQKHMLKRSAEAAEHLAKLVKSVLNVRQTEAGAVSIQLSAFALRPVVVDAAQLLDAADAGAQPRDLHLDVSDQIFVQADQDRVRQILLNLLSNATKYSPPGTPIEVSARLVAQRASRTAQATRGSRPDLTASLATMVAVAVRDHGAGVPPEQAVLLFQRFVRLERDIASRISGTGLGLAICRAYLEAMGGHIWVESTGVVGEGSTFTFTLPTAERVDVRAAGE